MGPVVVQESTEAPVNYGNPSGVTVTSPQSRQNRKSKSIPDDWGITRKFRLCRDVVDRRGDILKSSVASIQKLSKLALPGEIVQYKRVWIEGLEAETFTSELTVQSRQSKQSEVIDKDGTYFCVLMDNLSQVTLQDWLDCRGERLLYRFQINALISQILSAIKFLMENEIDLLNELRCSNISVQLSPLDSEIVPKLKINCLNLESVVSGDTAEALVSTSFKATLDFVSDLFSELLQRSIEEDTTEEVIELKGSVESVYPDEWQLIQNLRKEEEILPVLTETLEKLTTLNEKCSPGILLNLREPKRDFAGRKEELQTLLQNLTGEKNESGLIAIHGSSGAGKSELIYKLAKNLLANNGGESPPPSSVNILSFNASTVGTLTDSIYGCAAMPKLSVPTKDYINNPKPLKDIFEAILVVLCEKNVLLVIENVHNATEEVTDLLSAFKEHLKCDQRQESESRSRLHMLLAMEEIWTSNPLLEGCIAVPLNNFTSADSANYLRNSLFLKGENDDLHKLSEILHNSPSAMQLTITYARNAFEKSSADLLAHFNEFIQKYSSTRDVQCECEPNLQSIRWAYSMSLNCLYESVSEDDKLLTNVVLEFLQHFNGLCGISMLSLLEILECVPELKGITITNLRSLVNSLWKLSLVCYRDGVITVPLWMQRALGESLELLGKPDQLPMECISGLLLAIQSCLQSISSRKSNDKRGNGSDLVSHAMNLWTWLVRRNSALAKQFETVPELIAKVSVGEFAKVTGFLKEAADLLTAANNDCYNMHVLKLKFLLAKNSLLPQNKLNEAFLVFKSVNEQSRTEPREFLILKLRSLIELGKVHLKRQEYEKAVSCFQQVQIFAVQKISTVELDSEPTVLNARMNHGYALFLQDNLVEAKKILLEVVPLLERYMGADAKQVGGILLQAKFHLACLLRKSGDLVNALMMHTRVIDEKQKLFGKKHPETWASLQEMAMLFSAYDNHEKALILLRELLEIQEEILGAPSNRHSLGTMNAIAEIELKLGNFDDALELYEAIDLIEQEVLGEQDEMRISTQVNQAEVLMSLGQYKEAVDIFDLVYALRSTSEDKSVKNLQLCEDIMRKREKAGRSMEILGNYWIGLTPENVDDPSELTALAKKHEVAMELSENQDNHGALRFLREVLEDSTSLEDTNRFLLSVKADLARVLGLVGKFNESFSVYKEIIPLMDATFGETDELTMLCKDTMGQVFLFSGNQFLKRQMSNLKWLLL